MLERIQHELFEIGAAIALPGYAENRRLSRLRVLERELDVLNAALPPLKEFVLPGGNRAGRDLATSHARYAAAPSAELGLRQKTIRWAPSCCATSTDCPTCCSSRRVAWHGRVAVKRSSGAAKFCAPRASRVVVASRTPVRGPSFDRVRCRCADDAAAASRVGARTASMAPTAPGTASFAKGGVIRAFEFDADRKVVAREAPAMRGGARRARRADRTARIA